jgi:hypothetical protein
VRTLAPDGVNKTTTQKEDHMDNDETVGGYAVPVDPMDLLQCDSCQ